jgi:hypothetical protein
MHSILLIPELLDLTLKQLDTHDHAALLRVSQWFFRAAAPFIWEDLYEISKLLFLIPGAKFIIGANRKQVIVSSWFIGHRYEH